MPATSSSTGLSIVREVRKRAGKIWSQIVNLHRQVKLDRTNSAKVCRQVLTQPRYWHRTYLVRAYLEGAVKSFDESRNLDEPEYTHAKREFLRVIHTPFSNVFRKGSQQLSWGRWLDDTITSLVNAIDYEVGDTSLTNTQVARNLKEEILRVTQPLGTLLRDECTRLHEEGYMRGNELIVKGVINPTDDKKQEIILEPSTNEFDPNQPRDEQGRWTDTRSTSATRTNSNTPKLRQGNITRTPIKDLATKLFQRDLTDNEVRDIGFSPEGTQVTVGVVQGAIYTNTVSNSTVLDSTTGKVIPELSCSRKISKPWFGPLTCYNSSIQIPKNGKYGGMGFALFHNQVETLRKLGVKRIVATAAGDASDPKGGIGYYVWPRYGYSGTMSSKQIAKLPREFQVALKGKRDIRDLFDLPGGKEAWQKHGSSIKVWFDLSDNSRNMRALATYKIERESRLITHGGEGSGNFGHAGRPGKVGGSVSQGTVMYRGVGEGADISSGFEWYSETEKLASRYADFRGGRVISESVAANKPIDIGNAFQVLSASSFAAKAMNQADVKSLDKHKALAQRKKFLEHFGTSEREIIDYWSSPEAKEATRDFLEAFGFDSIHMIEGGEKTIGVLRRKNEPQSTTPKN